MHAVRGGDVDLVVVDGSVVAEGGRLARADLAELIARARAAVPGLFERRAAYLAEHGSPVTAISEKASGS